MTVREWIKHYGVVTAISVGLVGAFFLWAVNVQVTAQTSDLDSRIMIVESNLAAIRHSVDALQTTYDLLAARQDATEAWQARTDARLDATEAWQARADQNFAIILAEIRKLQTQSPSSIDDE